MKFEVWKSYDRKAFALVTTFTKIGEIGIDMLAEPAFYRIRATAEPGDIIVPPTIPPPGAEFTKG